MKRDLPNPRQGHKRQIRLRDDGRHARPVGNLGLPLHDHVALVDVVDDEGEGVDQSQYEHGVAGPVMEDLSGLVGWLRIKS